MDLTYLKFVHALYILIIFHFYYKIFLAEFIGKIAVTLEFQLIAKVINTLGSQLRNFLALEISGFLRCGSSSTAAVRIIGLFPPTSFLMITANSVKSKYFTVTIMIIRNYKQFYVKYKQVEFK